MSGLLIMAPFAERLPILLIPEQHLITPVRYDMVYHRSRGGFSILQTLMAQRMPLQKQYPGFPPLGIIAPRGCVASQRILRPFLPVFFTVGSCLTQIRASRILAWPFRFAWHIITPLGNPEAGKAGPWRFSRVSTHRTGLPAPPRLPSLC